MRYEEALRLYRRVGSVVGEANCIVRQGDVSRAEGNKAEAKWHFHAALALYERVHRIDSMALTHERLAWVTEGTERAAQVQGARAAWLSMNVTAEAERISRRFA